MSKIEEFHQALNTASRIAEAVCRSLGRDRSDNDKHTARCQFRKIENDTWTPMLLAVDMSYGYYGSSSGYSATSKEMGEYLAKAINKHMATLLDDAAAMAKADAEKARKAAEDEAKAVLEQTAA